MAHVPELTGVCVIRVLSALTGELILEALVDEADLVSTPNFRDDLRRYIQAKTGISSFRQQLLVVHGTNHRPPVLSGLLV